MIYLTITYACCGKSLFIIVLLADNGNVFMHILYSWRLNYLKQPHKDLPFVARINHAFQTRQLFVRIIII